MDTLAGLALIAGALILLLISALKAPATRHARVTREGGTAFLGEKLMHLGYGWIDGLARGCARAGFSAATVSWLSLALGLLAGVLAACGRPGAAAWALTLSGLGDALDGAIARLQGTASRGGAVLDSALDRYVEFFLYAGLLYFFRAQSFAQLLAIIALFGGFMVTYSTAKAEALQVKPPRGWMKRAERLVWLTGGCAAAAGAGVFGLGPAPVLIGVCAVIAVFANLSAIVRLRALCQSV
ncbi:MAG: CDP-alcohol phosphatidyltransferase family protein [Opitutaceae bacterium]|nr:CDP-alcohol phosphatidyltransferase family protein [Opitutaceae bacterium]